MALAMVLWLALGPAGGVVDWGYRAALVLLAAAVAGGTAWATRLGPVVTAILAVALAVAADAALFSLVGAVRTGSVAPLEWLLAFLFALIFRFWMQSGWVFLLAIGGIALWLRRGGAAAGDHRVC